MTTKHGLISTAKRPEGWVSRCLCGHVTLPYREREHARGWLRLHVRQETE